MKKTLAILALISSMNYYAQDEDWDFDEDNSNKDNSSIELDPAFNDTRVINSHSSETLEKGTLDFRIAHRFGNMATPKSYQTFFGLDNISDVRIGFDYGITENLMVGIHRNKGAGPYTQLFEGLVKYKLIDQLNDKPLTISINSSAFATTMESSSDSTSVTFFSKDAHRLSYYSQIIVARNLKNKASIQMNLGYLHRNLVYQEDINDAITLGGVAKVKVGRKVSIIGEYNHIFRPTNTINSTEFVDPIGLGVEIKTFAHVFQINLTNSRGIGALQYIPYTTSKWSDGQFRLGFTISRHF